MIVIPMAGLSSRFTRAGYTTPKYKLPLNGFTVFDYALASFRDVFDSEVFLFVAMNQPGLRDFLSERLALLGIRKYHVILLENMTRGQAETVALGLDLASVGDDVPITVFNIDTFCLTLYVPLSIRFPEVAGVLQVFRGDGDSWSFVEPDPEKPGRALRTAEKVRISDLCCTGLYQFACVGKYRQAYRTELDAPQAKELYIAPIYNHLIAQGDTIAYEEVAAEDVVFCGVPAEYEALLQPDNPLRGRAP
ncbi:glycosyltransferase family protein [Xanthobacter agilis]|uniref:capsular biosynthesis protein n=1 Tax=Xanthobacter agilis TaxID=47492 RepID=UPI00372713B3